MCVCRTKLSSLSGSLISNCMTTIDYCFADVHSGRRARVSAGSKAPSAFLCVSVTNFCHLDLCAVLHKNCTHSAWPLDLTLIQESTLRIASYKYSTLSPSYLLLFINHSNWEGMLWLEENTCHTIAMIPLSLQKLTHYTGCFLGSYYSQKTEAS